MPTEIWGWKDEDRDVLFLLRWVWSPTRARGKQNAYGAAAFVIQDARSRDGGGAADGALLRGVLGPFVGACVVVGALASAAVRGQAAEAAAAAKGEEAEVS